MKASSPSRDDYDDDDYEEGDEGSPSRDDDYDYDYDLGDEGSFHPEMTMTMGNDHGR